MQINPLMPLLKRLKRVFLEKQRGVLSAEAESIAEGVADVPFACCVEGEIEFRVDLWVVLEVVDGGWDDAFVQRHDGGAGFHGAGTSKQVAGHGFGGVEADVVASLAKNFLDGDDFG